MGKLSDMYLKLKYLLSDNADENPLFKKNYDDIADKILRNATKQLSPLEYREFIVKQARSAVVRDSLIKECQKIEDYKNAVVSQYDYMPEPYNLSKQELEEVRRKNKVKDTMNTIINFVNAVHNKCDPVTCKKSKEILIRQGKNRNCFCEGQYID